MPSVKQENMASKVSKFSEAAKSHIPTPNNPISECQKATSILQSFDIGIPGKGLYPDRFIPASIFARAKGVAILRVLKAGFGWSGRVGTGLVVAKVPSSGISRSNSIHSTSHEHASPGRSRNTRWSAPSMIMTAGVGFGFQTGVEVTDILILLMTTSAVKAFSHGGNLTLGGNLSVAAGPLGRSAEIGAAAMNIAPIYAYSKAKGIFAGVSIEGSAIKEWSDSNKRLYGAGIKSKEILSGRVEVPVGARELIAELERKVEQCTLVPPPMPGQAPSEVTGDGAYQQQPNRRSSWSAKPSTAYPPAPGAESKIGAVVSHYVGRLQRRATSSRRPDAAEEKRKEEYNPVQPQSDSYLKTADDSQKYATLPPAYSTGDRSSKPLIDRKESQRSESGPSSRLPDEKAPLVPSNSQQSSSPQLPARPQVVTALYGYDATAEGDLGFHKGDRITVLKSGSSSNEWWFGRCNGKEGMFPANYVK